MKKNQLILSILLVGIAFGTAWAIRGQFGHEPGAAFAGIIGVAALLLVAGRQDWYNKMLPIIAAGAIGWGTTGMISYGMVVGYCRAEDLLNSTYGFLSLFVIGALYFGLTLAIILLLPLISQLMHGGIPNANMRFPLQP